MPSTASRRHLGCPIGLSMQQSSVDALALHLAYDASGRLLGRPDDELFAELGDGTFFRELDAAVGVMPDGIVVWKAAEHLAEAWRASASSSPEALDERFQRFFGGHAPLCSPFASEHADPSPYRRSQLLRDLAGVYEWSGVLLPEAGSCRIDHVAIELEFAGLLAAKESRAITRDESVEAKQARDARRCFLCDHLSPALAAFDMRMQRCCDDPFLAASSRFAAAVVRWDCKRLGIEGGRAQRTLGLCKAEVMPDGVVEAMPSRRRDPAS